MAFYSRQMQPLLQSLIQQFPIEIKTSATPDKKMAKNFGILKANLPESEIKIGHGAIINQYPQRLWLAEDLVALPFWML